MNVSADPDDLIAGDVNCDPRLTDIHWVTVRVFEHEGPVAALRELRRFRRHLLEMIGGETEAIPHRIERDRAGGLFLELGAWPPLRKQVDGPIDLPVRVNIDAIFLGPFNHVTFEAGIAHPPPWNWQVSPEEVLVSFGSTLLPHKSVLHSDRCERHAELVPLWAELDASV
jgi:hypothetical protein